MSIIVAQFRIQEHWSRVAVLLEQCLPRMNGYVVRQDLSEDPETFHFDFILPDGSLLIQAYPDISLVLIVEWPEIGDPDELRFDRFPAS